MQEGSNDSGDVQPAVRNVLLVCDEGVRLDAGKNAQLQPLSVHLRTPEILLDVSFFIRMPQPQPHTAAANSMHMPLDLLKDELLIAITSSRLNTVDP